MLLSFSSSSASSLYLTTTYLHCPHLTSVILPSQSPSKFAHFCGAHFTSGPALVSSQIRLSITHPPFFWPFHTLISNSSAIHDFPHSLIILFDFSNNDRKIVREFSDQSIKNLRNWPRFFLMPIWFSVQNSQIGVFWKSESEKWKNLKLKKPLVFWRILSKMKRFQIRNHLLWNQIPEHPNQFHNQAV